MNQEKLNFTVWVFNKPNDENVSFAYNSVKQEGIMRFGWGSYDLNQLQNGKFEGFTTDQKLSWKKTNFLLQIKPGDWIVQVSVPSYGKCIAAKVIEPYSFNNLSAEGDFGHGFKLDKKSIVEFNRNDPNVLPIISRRLKLQGHYWRIYYKIEFLQSIENVINKTVCLQQNESAGVYHLRKELHTTLSNLNSLIHKNFPEKKLEKFIAQIFRKIPNVTEVKENGSGYGTDYGADLIISYTTGLDILNLLKEEKLVVQVKSYKGINNDFNILKQLKTGIEKYNGNCGMIVSTATLGEGLLIEIDKLQEEINKPIAVIAGVELSEFVLKYYSDELLF